MITSILHETKIEISRRAREEATEMRKEYRNAIISGIGVAMVNTILKFTIRGQFSWTFVIFSSVVYPFAFLIGLRLYKRKEAKKEGDVQRRE